MSSSFNKNSILVMSAFFHLANEMGLQVGIYEGSVFKLSQVVSLRYLNRFNIYDGKL